MRDLFAAVSVSPLISRRATWHTAKPQSCPLWFLLWATISALADQFLTWVVVILPCLTFSKWCISQNAPWAIFSLFITLKRTTIFILSLVHVFPFIFCFFFNTEFSFISDKIFNTVNCCRCKQIRFHQNTGFFDFIDSSCCCSVLFWHNAIYVVDGSCFSSLCVFRSSLSYKRLIYLHRYHFVQPYKCDPKHLFETSELNRLSEICLCFSVGIVWLLGKKGNIDV